MPYLSCLGCVVLLVYGPTRSVAACTHTSSTPTGSFPATSFFLGDGEACAGEFMMTVRVVLDTSLNGEGIRWCATRLDGYSAGATVHSDQRDPGCLRDSDLHTVSLIHTHSAVRVLCERAQAVCYGATVVKPWTLLDMPIECGQEAEPTLLGLTRKQLCRRVLAAYVIPNHTSLAAVARPRA